MSVKNGEAAFPRPLSTGILNYEKAVAVGQTGMTLRDYFAGQALTNQAIGEAYHSQPDLLAGRAYEYADAMLKARDSV